MKSNEKKYRITNMDRLKMVRRINREIMSWPKPTRITDKRKQANKDRCRNGEDEA
jgi:hypothetical protein